MKHLNAIALALLHIPFQSRAFNTVTRTGICDKHWIQLKQCCNQGLRVPMTEVGNIYGKSASLSFFCLKAKNCDRNRFSPLFRPSIKSFSTKMTASSDVFNMQQDWQDLKRSIQAIEPKYRSSFVQQLLPLVAALIFQIYRAFQSSVDEAFLLDKIKECEGLSAGTTVAVRKRRFAE